MEDKLAWIRVRSWWDFKPGQSIWALRKRVAWVAPALESDYRYPDTVRDCIGSGFDSTVGLLRPLSDQERQRVDELLATLALQDLQQRRISALSYGQRRRVMIARALVNRPRLLLLDEPTEGMDAAARSDFERLLHKVITDDGCQLVCASHYRWGTGLFTHQLSLAEGHASSERYS